MEWQPIETAPKGQYPEHPWVLLSCWHFQADEDGNEIGDPLLIWQHVGTWFMGQWQTVSDGFFGIGPNAWMPLRGNPTHWMPLPAPPEMKD